MGDQFEYPDRNRVYRDEQKRKAFWHSIAVFVGGCIALAVFYGVTR
jgi:hypothetical protein